MTVQEVRPPGLAEQLFGGVVAPAPDNTFLLESFYDLRTLYNPDYARYLKVKVHERIAFRAEKLASSKFGKKAPAEAENVAVWNEAAGIEKQLLLDIIATYSPYTSTFVLTDGQKSQTLGDLKTEEIDDFIQNHVHISDGLADSANYLG